MTSSISQIPWISAISGFGNQWTVVLVLPETSDPGYQKSQIPLPDCKKVHFGYQNLQVPWVTSTNGRHVLMNHDTTGVVLLFFQIPWLPGTKNSTYHWVSNTIGLIHTTKKNDYQSTGYYRFTRTKVLQLLLACVANGFWILLCCLGFHENRILAVHKDQKLYSSENLGT